MLGKTFLFLFWQCWNPRSCAPLVKWAQEVWQTTLHSALAQAQAAVFELPPQPLLYLHGQTDGCMAPALAGTTGDYLNVAGSRAVMIENAGHFLQLEQPAEVNAEILAFLAE